MCALAKSSSKATRKAAVQTSSKKLPKTPSLSQGKTSAKSVAKVVTKTSNAAKAKTAALGSLASPLLGKKAPSFTAAATSNKEVSSKSLLGHPWVLYFYPKDHTPGCTVEGQDFKAKFAKFRALDCEIFGISKDSLKRHDSFKEKFDFPFDLLVDDDEAVCRKFEVIQMKKLYGREYEGIERSTFLVDSKGVVRGEWRQVKVPGHVDEVLRALTLMEKK